MPVFFSFDQPGKTSWKISTELGSDFVLPRKESGERIEAEIELTRDEYILRNKSQGSIRINRNEFEESPLPDRAYLWFGGYRCRWERPNLFLAPARGFLYIRDLCVSRGNNIILQNLSFGIDHDTGMTGILGPSGCGKSTLIKELLEIRGTGSANVLVHPDSSIGYIPQEDILPQYLKVKECLFQSILFREPFLSYPAAKKKAGDIAEILGLSLHLDQVIRNLSGGQRKRVSVAMELAGEPDILMLDEPTSGLDPQSQKTVMDNLRKISKESEVTIICVTHALETVSYFDQIVILRPLSKSPSSTESSLCYAGPNRGGERGTLEEICRDFELERFTDIFLPRPPQTPTNRTSSGDSIVSLNESDVRLTEKLPTPQDIRSCSKQALLIASRTSRHVTRNPASFWVTIALPLLIGTLVFVAEGRVEAMDIRVGLQGLFLYSGITAIWLGMTLVIRTVVSERSITSRDVRTGLSPVSYGLGKVLFLIGGAVVQTVVLTGVLVTLHMLAPYGLQLGFPWPTPALVLPFAVLLFLMILGGGFLGLVVSAVVRKEYVAVSILPLLMIPHLLFNMSTYQATGFYSSDNPYNPIFWFLEAEYGGPASSGEERIQAVISLPLLSRPFLNILEGRSAAIQRRELIIDADNAVGHRSQEFVNTNRRAFAREWIYFLTLLSGHALAMLFFFHFFLPKTNPASQRLS